MPPRSKQGKEDWVKCPMCGCLFGGRDQSVHDMVCCKTVKTTVEAVSHSHGFIWENCLFGTLIKWSGDDGLNSGCRRGVVLLNPSTMRLLELGIGDVCVVDLQVALPVWPCPTMALTNLAITKPPNENVLPIDIDTKVRLRKLSVPHVCASHMCLQPVEAKSFMASQNFRHFLINRYAGSFYTQSNRISTSYLGQPCELLVTEIRGNPALLQAQCQSSLYKAPPGGSSPMDRILSELGKLQLKDGLSSLPDFYKLTSSTIVTVESSTDVSSTTDPVKGRPVSLDDVGGLDKQIAEIKELMELQLVQDSPLKHLGDVVPRGVLLFGPSGTGKSLMCRALSANTQAHVVKIHGSDIWSRFYGESETKLKTLFEEAVSRAPSLILIDEIDALCPRRETAHSEVERRVVTAVLSLLDRTLTSASAVMVLAATNRRDAVEPALRRPGRLDREVEIGVPSAIQRAEILRKLLNRTEHDIPDRDLVGLAERAHGFVGADLAAVTKEGLVEALRLPGESAKLTLGDLECGLQKVQPSAMREVALEIPQVKWTDIGGQGELKHKLRQAVEWPLRHPEAFLRLGIRAPRGLLMYGPPGCSKTMIAKALARESGLNFIAIKGPELFSKWVGESERAVREVFRKARAAAPAIVFFDEIDALAGERGSGSSGGGDVSDRVLAQLLTEIDGVDVLQDVTVVAATNRPDRIDKALLRPGRLDRVVYVPLPDPATRREIFHIQFTRTPTADNVSVDRLVSATEGYSGAEVTAVCHEAALCAMQENIDIPEVHSRHFDQALKAVTPRITSDMIQFYEQYQTTSGPQAV